MDIGDGMRFKLARLYFKLTRFFYNISRISFSISNYFEKKEGKLWSTLPDQCDVVSGVPTPEIIPFRCEEALRIAKGIHFKTERERVDQLMSHSQKKICDKVIETHDEPTEEEMRRQKLRYQQLYQNPKL